jgi:hypothetical protein
MKTHFLPTLSVLAALASPYATAADGWTRHYDAGATGGVLVEPQTPSSDWGSGFSGNIKITNNSGEDIASWTVEFDAPWTVDWNGAGSWDITESHHVVTNPTGWDGNYTLAAGASFDLGFTGVGPWSVPTNITANGQAAGDNPNNTKLATWMNRHGITEATGDIDANDLPDLIDFLVGNNPDGPGGNPSPVSAAIRTLTVGGQENSYFCVELDADSFAQGVEYRIETSADLSTWTGGDAAMVLHETTEGANGRVHALWRGAAPIGAVATRRFAHLVARIVEADAGDIGGGSGGGTIYTGEDSPITLVGVDGETQAAQVTIEPDSAFTLTIDEGTAPFTTTVNHPAALSATVSGSTVTLTGTAGMRSGLKITDSTGAVRLLGVRVKNTNGTNPGLPTYLSVGSVSEDCSPDLTFFSEYAPGTRKNRWVDYRYIYINGGVKRKGVGWRTWGKDGERVSKFVRESLKRGMIPVLVWYNIPDGGESYTTDLAHMQEEDYMQGYFEDLKFAIDRANEQAGDEMVVWLLEPDFVGYMAQNNRDPETLMAQTHAAYDIGTLSTAHGDPVFPDTMRGLVEAINYTIKKHATNAYIGWQFNLWAFPPGGWNAGSHVGGKGIMRVTDGQDIDAGRQIVRNEGLSVADYYISCGVLTHGADFISIDKYGLDGAYSPYGKENADNPADSTWFWNAEHWGNYLHFVAALHERTGKQVMLWQLPVGHINSSQFVSPYTGAPFPDLADDPGDTAAGTPPEWEDSAPTFFFGDTFKPGTTVRYAWFKTNRGGYANVTLDPDGETIAWGDHMAEARDAGVHVMLFGDGVGASTHGRGVMNGDHYWWISAVQKYFENPASLAP